MMRFSRRTALRHLSAGAATGLLGPTLHSLVASAQGTAPAKKRLLWMNVGNGWGHQGSTRNAEVLDAAVRADGTFPMPVGLMLLAPMASKVSIVRGLYNPYGVNLHGNGWAMLTATPPVNNLPGGVSIDRAIAKAIGTSDPFDQIHIGLARFGQLNRINIKVGTSSADGPGRPYPAVPSPLRAYQTYFGNLVGKSPTEVTALLAEDKSLLDGVCGDIQSTSARLAGAERQKLDQLLESCRSLEKQIAKRAATTTGGAGPQSMYLDLDKSGLRADVLRGLSDVIVNAFAFNITRVAHYTWLGFDAFNDSWSSFGVPGDAHTNYAHRTIPGWTTKAQYDEGMVKITQVQSGELAYIFTRLREFQDGGRTLADGTLGVWTNAGGGKHHDGTNNHAAVLVGDLGGALKAGKYHEYAVRTRSMADLFVTVAQLVGAKIDKFGEPMINRGPLTELL